MGTSEPTACPGGAAFSGVAAAKPRQRPSGDRRTRKASTCGSWWRDDYPEAPSGPDDLLNFEGIEDVDAASSGAEVLGCLEGALERRAALRPGFLDWSCPIGMGARYWTSCASSLISRPPPSSSCRCCGPATARRPRLHLDGLHFCDKPVLPGPLRRLRDTLLGRMVASPVAARGVTGALDGMRVPLVEDNATGRDVAIAPMGRWGVEVDTAGDGRDAPRPTCRPASRSLRPGLHGSVNAGHGRLARPFADSRPAAPCRFAHLCPVGPQRSCSAGALPRHRHERLLNKPYELSELYKILCALSGDGG